MSEKRYVLYVNNCRTNAQRLCRGSEMCVSEIDERMDVHVQPIAKLMQKDAELPAWLNGTPICVDRHTSQAYKGTSAVSFVQSLRTNAADAATAHAGQKAPAHDFSRPSSSRTEPKVASIEGMVAAGEQFSHGSDLTLENSFQTLTTNAATESSKVTENMLEEYMRKRGVDQAPDPK